MLVQKLLKKFETDIQVSQYTRVTHQRTSREIRKIIIIKTKEKKEKGKDPR